ncbi:MAG TPA: CoA transferase [Steroidobacteraceae bacterium]|jgi:crotonobetainyl-CoA:carnitine CoA-transferase CaiB-like acyl-CoA transferase|nr:CoA transferase [Steroidobacteraceae bacterium]
MNTLQGHRVLALGDTAAGALARLLRSFGAQIRPTTLQELKDALARASFLLEDRGLALLERSGWTRARIEAINPGLIHVSVTCFGSAGPRAEWHGSELIASATGGALRLTGQPDRAPVKEALDACLFHADMVAAAGLMAAHYERGQSGRGQHVDIAAQEVALSRNVSGILVWQFDRRKLSRVGGALNYGRATVRCIWALADGWCFHSLMTGRFGAPANQALSDWIDEAGLDNPLRGTDWLRYDRSSLDPQLRLRWEAAIEAFFRTRSRSQVTHDGRRRGINATVLASPADVLADPHLQARDFWRQEPARRTPAHFVRFEAGSQAAPCAHPPTARPGPLSGVRVLDFSWALVGSITTKVLGDLGAEVIKVESRTRPCLSRLDVQVAASSARSLDDKPWFAHLNSSKKSLSIDLKIPASREVIAPLIAWADLVVENFSPGTMAKLGLAFPQLQQINPDIILVSGSVFGQTGPLAQEWGVDGTGAALSGRTLLTGWPDRDPVIPGAVPYGDVIVPYVMVAAALAVLQHRRERGGGGHIDAAMYEICVQQMYAALIAAQTDQPPQRRANRDASFYHQGVYPVAGDDRWIAISCRTQADWQCLSRISGADEHGSDAQREQQLAAWSATRSGEQLVETLQAAGIAAGLAEDIEDLLEHDPQVKARESLTALDHAQLGKFGHVRTPISFSRSLIAPYCAPRIGEHNEWIARRLAGLSAERYEAFVRREVFK